MEHVLTTEEDTLQDADFYMGAEALGYSCDVHLRLGCK